MKNLLMSMALAACVLGGCRQRDGNGSGNILLVPDQYATITAALRVARNGDIVEVTRSGRYSEATGEVFPLFVPSGVTLRKGWARGVTIDMDSAIPLAILNPGNDVTVEGLSFVSTAGHTTPAIECIGYQNVTIQYCGFYVRSGILFDGVRNMRIEYNNFYPQSAIGTQAITIWRSEDIVVKNNTFASFSTNVLVEDSTNVRLERNLVVNASTNGIEVDDASFATMRILENDVWGNREGMWNNTTMRPFFPATGGNISADPLFIDREGPYEVHESSPCILANGGMIGAFNAVKLGAKPQITKAPTSTSVINGGQNAPIVDIVLANVGNDRVLFAPGRRIWTTLTTSASLGGVAIHVRDMTTGLIVAEENTSAPLRPFVRTLELNQNFPATLDPGKQLDLRFEFTATATSIPIGASVQIDITSMEWGYGGGQRVNDGFSPQGLPITHTVVKP